jgi:hypothetical protein
MRIQSPTIDSFSIYGSNRILHKIFGRTFINDKSKMTDFPTDLFGALAHTSVSIERKLAQSEAERKEKVEAKSVETDGLTDEERRAHQTAHEAEQELAQSLERECEYLRAKKAQLDEDKHCLERQIMNLHEEINRTEHPKDLDRTSDASLALFRQLAPLRISEVSGTRVHGLIAFGTADKTVDFECDRGSGFRGIDGFWDLLGGVSGMGDG